MLARDGQARIEGNGQYLVVIHMWKHPSPTEEDHRAYRLGPQGDERGNAKLPGAAALAAEGAMMKRKYDFSKGERGKFYKPGAVFKLPVYVDEEVQTYLADKADAKGVDLSDLVKEMLKKEIEIIEVVR